MVVVFFMIARALILLSLVVRLTTVSLDKYLMQKHLGVKKVLPSKVQSHLEMNA